MRINRTNNIRQVLHYHENKVKQGRAVLIGAGNFLRTPPELQLGQMVKRLKDLADLNQLGKNRFFHASLSFHPADAVKLTTDLLRHISAEYLERIGLGRQPYLIYQHFDTVHPHVHIVSTYVQPDGRLIDLHNRYKYLATLSLELTRQYGLVEPKKGYLRERDTPYAQEAQRAVYGETTYKPAISKVLESVIDRYRYTSLEEFNAVLRPYNIGAVATTASKKNHDHNNGLVYSLLDAGGRKKGKPIWSSSFFFKPTLQNLENRFAGNEKARMQYRQSLITRIRWTSRAEPDNMHDLVRMLEKERIVLAIRHNDQGEIYGFIYVDQEHHTVFSERDLEKDCSAPYLLGRFGICLDKERMLETRENERSRFPRLSVATDLSEGSTLAELFQKSAKDRERSLLAKEKGWELFLGFGAAGTDRNR